MAVDFETEAAEAAEAAGERELQQQLSAEAAEGRQHATSRGRRVIL